MSLSKWIMKQYWRVGTIRTIASLILGMLVLGRYYYGYVPFLAPLGVIGAIILGFVLILLFLGVGFLYDVRFKMWNENFRVLIERDPYQLTPNYRTWCMEFPILIAFLDTMRKISLASGIDTSSIDNLIIYYSRFFKFNPASRNDLRESAIANRDFLDSHPFVTGPSESSQLKRSWGERTKKSFQTQVTRINYIQSLTGLFQDVLVLAALYSPFLLATVFGGSPIPSDVQVNTIFLFAFPLLVLLVALGWFYDKRLKLWGPDYVVKMERDPYSYVPEPKYRVAHYPFILAIISVHSRIMNKEGMDTNYVDQVVQYMKRYFDLSPTSKKHIVEGGKLRILLHNPWQLNRNKGEM